MSVVIAAYNAADFITETIESVRAQTYSNWELVVVDDGSTDETLAVVRASGVPAERLRVLSMANGGPGAARNHGIEHTRGNLIAFLDHDDVWLPHKLAAQVEVMLNGPCDVVISDWYPIGFGGASIPPPDEGVRHLADGVYAGSEMFTLLWDYNRFPPSAVLVTKAAVKRAGMFPDERTGGEWIEDYSLWLRLARDGCTFAAIKQVLYGHRIGPSRSSAILKVREGDVAVLSLFADDMTRIDPERHRRRMAGLYDGIAVLRAESGDLAGASAALAQLRGLQAPRQVRAKMLALALVRSRYAGLMRRVRAGDQNLAGARPYQAHPRAPS